MTKITNNELREMFGKFMPMEALSVLWENISIDEMRSKLHLIAAERTYDPTIRDNFAMSAMSGLAALAGNYESPAEMALDAYKIADAMLSVRNVSEDNKLKQRIAVQDLRIETLEKVIIECERELVELRERNELLQANIDEIDAQDQQSLFDRLDAESDDT